MLAEKKKDEFTHQSDLRHRTGLTLSHCASWKAHTHDVWVFDHEGHFVVMSFNVLGRIMHVPMYEMRSSSFTFVAIEIVDRCYATRQRNNSIAPIKPTHGQVLLSDDEHLILE